MFAMVPISIDSDSWLKLHIDRDGLWTPCRAQNADIGLETFVTDGDDGLLYESQWRYHIEKTYLAHKRGMEVSELQSRWNGTGYSCDLCRIELSYYEFMYHCQDYDDNHQCNKQKHDFCVSCVYAILCQYNQMKPFLAEMLKNVLNDHCIDEIVAFCVGKIIKFDCIEK